ncbi:MAG: ribonuclease P protein component [Dehalococcoidia bacterium]|nr:ribonuclease P protein component [Dehalococcoidia bacterium]
MERRRRLSGKKIFNAIHKGGGRWYNPIMGLKALPNREGTTRYAFRAGKNVGKAVERNRVKRLMREASRLVTVPEGWDLLFTARTAAKSSNLWQIKRALEDILARAHVLLSQARNREPKEKNEQ